MVLCFSPFFSFNLRVQLVDVAFPDLLSCFGLQNLSQELPIFTNFLNHLFNDLIFFRLAYFLLVPRNRQSSEPVQALILISFRHETRDDAPLLWMFLI